MEIWKHGINSQVEISIVTRLYTFCVISYHLIVMNFYFYPIIGWRSCKTLLYNTKLVKDEHSYVKFEWSYDIFANEFEGLRCQLRSNNQVRNKLLFVNKQGQAHSSQRVKWSGNASNHSIIFHISDLQKHDTGEYMCFVAFGENRGQVPCDVITLMVKVSNLLSYS